MPNNIYIKALRAFSTSANDNALHEVVNEITSNAFDWKHFEYLMHLHKITSLVSTKLKEKNLLHIVPPDTLAEINKTMASERIRNIRIRSVMSKVQTIFGHHNIEFILLKGVYLQYLLYPQPFYRPMVDIDILVKPNALSQVRDLLQRAGGIEIVNAQSEIANTLRQHTHPIVIDNIAIEVHRSLVPEYDLTTFSEEIIWQHTMFSRLDNIQYKVCTNELNLIHLCVHLHNAILGGQLKLFQLNDIYFFIQSKNSSIDWEYVLTLSKCTNASQPLLSILNLICKFYTYTINNQYITSILKETPHDLYPIEKLLMAEHVKGQESFILQRFKKIRGMKQKTSFLLSLLIPSKKYLLYTYKKSTYVGALLLNFKDLNRKLFR